MKLSTRGDYAIRALLELATEVDLPWVPLAELAERTGISPKYLEQILMRLRTARVVKAKRGARGGYAFARPIGDVTIGEVVRVMDGPLAPSLCASRTAHQPCPVYRCPSEDDCVLHGLWVDVRDAISQVVDGTTFGDLVERRRRQESEKREMYHI
ncbi:MAG: Rrf2 family transcriptional regulator [Dehalococcoidia bacterium]